MGDENKRSSPYLQLALDRGADQWLKPKGESTRKGRDARKSDAGSLFGKYGEIHKEGRKADSH